MARWPLVISTHSFLFHVDIEENGVRLHLNVVDTPGFGDFVNNDDRLVTLYRHRHVYIITRHKAGGLSLKTSSPGLTHILSRRLVSTVKRSLITVSTRVSILSSPQVTRKSC